MTDASNDAGRGAGGDEMGEGGENAGPSGMTDDDSEPSDGTGGAADDPMTPNGTGGNDAMGGAGPNGQGGVGGGGDGASGGNGNDSGGSNSGGSGNGGASGGPANGGNGEGGENAGGTGGESAAECVEGAVCTPDPAGCLLGTIACVDGIETCMPSTAPRANGSECGDGMVCSDGECGACVEGLECDLGDPCGVGATSCASGVSTCERVRAVDGSEGQTCGIVNQGMCTEGTCECADGYTYFQGDCQPCPASSPASRYVNAVTGVDNQCCGDSSIEGLGGPCRTLTYFLQKRIPAIGVGVAVRVFGDAQGNASPFEVYPITFTDLGGGATIFSDPVYYPGIPGQPVFSVSGDAGPAWLSGVVIGVNGQGESSGASAGIYVGPGHSMEFGGNIEITGVDTGIVVDGGNVENGFDVSIHHVNSTGILCRSDTDSEATSEFGTTGETVRTPSVTIHHAPDYDIFAGMNCRMTHPDVQLGSGTSAGCPLGYVDRYGAYAEGNAVLYLNSSDIVCQSEYGFITRANPDLEVSSPDTSMNGNVFRSGCGAIRSEVGLVRVSNGSIRHNPWGIIQQSPMSSDMTTDQQIWMPGSSEVRLACNGLTPPPARCCTEGPCPPGGDVWNQSGLPLTASGVSWTAEPPAACLCAEDLTSCNCAGWALGETTPPAGINVLLSPYQGSGAPTITITNPALIDDITCE